MPVEYQPMQPVGAAIYAQQAQIEAQRRQAQMAAAASQASSGGGHASYDDGSNMQAAVFGRDQMQFQREKDNLDRTTTPQSEVFRAQAAMNQQRAGFELQAQLQQTELTQQEKMRLARMKNAIGDVQNDPTLSAEEKSDMTMQLKTGISPLAQRETAARVQAQTQMNEEKAKQIDLQAGAEQMRLDTLGKTMDQRSGFVPDAGALAQISDDIIKANPEMKSMLPQERDAAIAQLAKEEAMRQGLGHHTLLQPDGKLTILKGDGSISDTGSSASKGTVDKSGGHPSGLTPQELLKLREDASKQAHADLVATYPEDTPGGGKKRIRDVNPEDTEKWIADRTEQIVQKNLDALTAHNKERNPPVKGYDPSKAAWNKGKVVAAASPDAPKPISVEQNNKIANVKANQYLNRDDLAPEVRTQAAENVGVMRKLYEKCNGDFSKLTQPERDKMQAANDYLKANVPPAPGHGSQGQQQGGEPLPSRPIDPATAALQGQANPRDLPSTGGGQGGTIDSALGWLQQNAQGFDNRFSSGLKEVGGAIERGHSGLRNMATGEKRKKIGER